MKRLALIAMLSGSLCGCALDPATATLGAGALVAGYMATRTSDGPSGEPQTGTPPIPGDPLSLWWYAGAALGMIFVAKKKG